MAITASVRSSTDDLRQELLLDGRHTVVIDEPEQFGGTDTAPTPIELLAGAVAGCVTITLRMYARRKGWALDEVEVEVDDAARTVVLHRGTLRLACNLGAHPAALDLRTPIARILLASEPVQGEESSLTLPPEAFAIAQLG